MAESLWGSRACQQCVALAFVGCGRKAVDAMQCKVLKFRLSNSGWAGDGLLGSVLYKQA